MAITTEWNWEYITGSIATILGTGYAFYKKFNTQRFEKGLIEALTDKIEIHNKLIELKHNTLAPSVILWETKNGGGIPTGNNPVINSIFDEAPDSDISSLKADIKNMPTDTAMNRVLLKILEKGSLFFETVELERGILKEFYEKDKIKCGYIYKVGSADNKFFYLTVGYRELIENNINYELNLRTTSNNILNILKN